jgi:hypothetical protein
MKIRLELARTAELPEGSRHYGYEFIAPLTGDGHLDLEGWRRERAACRMHRFWQGEEDQYGQLLHYGGEHWAYHYDGMEEERMNRSFASIGIGSSRVNTCRSRSTTACNGRSW